MCIRDRGYTNIITRTHKELDLTRQEAVERFFTEEKPEYVFLAAADVYKRQSLLNARNEYYNIVFVSGHFSQLVATEIIVCIFHCLCTRSH